MRLGKCKVCYKEIKRDEEYWRLSCSSYGGFTHTKCRKSNMPEFTNYYLNGKFLKGK